MARGLMAGNRGQGSKWIAKKRRQAIYARDGRRCVWCRKQPEQLTLDHVQPRSLGGSNATHNLVTCCMGCNRERGDRSLLAFALAFRAPTQTILRVLRACERAA